MMVALDHSLRGGFAPPRLAPLPAIRLKRATLAAVALAVLIHICVVSALVILRPGAPLESATGPATLLVNIVTPEAAPDDPAAEIIEPVPAPEPEPQPVETRIEPAPAVLPAPRAAPAGTTTADAATEDPDASDGSVSGSVSVLTADGGHSEMPQYAAREGSALRGLFCATGARELRVAAGCDMLGEGAQGITGYGGDQPPDQLTRGFWMREEGPGSPGYTINTASLARPGQVFSQHSHFSRGAHSAFGQLPVQDKARDPGFGD
ncbi:MAG: hypothetical protein LAT81_09300 [Oceanicaulis sp.]|nr:hypothetical protein [Oceanicaulis sp.]